MELTLSQQLDLERLHRSLDRASPEQLLDMAHRLADAWMAQQAAARWAIKQGLPTSRLRGH
jgi:hypothetical protein